jgi:hypothetical protein
MFDGPVSTSYALSSDPTIGVAHGYGGQAPSKVLPDEDRPVTTEEIIGSYNEALAKMGAAESTLEVRDELYTLYQLAGMAKEETLKGEFNQFLRSVQDGQEAIYSRQDLNQTLINFAKVLYGKSMIRDEKYEEADVYLKQLNSETLAGYDKRDYLHLRVVTETYHGNYEGALQMLQAYYDFQEAQGEDMEEVRASNAPIEEDIRARMEGDGMEDSPESKITMESGMEKLSLGNYPNPFNPTTNITFNLPNKSTVSLIVYDMLGREVASLLNEAKPAGEHTVRFDASTLANGIYLYQLRVGDQQIIKKMTLIK